MPELAKPILMAVIGAAHGIKGELRVRTFTGDPLALGDYGPLQARDGRLFVIADIRPAKDVVVVRLKGVGDRNAAEALAGTELFVNRSALPDEGDVDDFYHADLVGLLVMDDTGSTVGKVVAVQNFGAGDLLEITFGARKGVLIPFSRAAVPEVSLAGGHIRIDRVAAGLVDDDNDSEAESAPDRNAGGRSRPRGRKAAGDNR